MDKMQFYAVSLALLGTVAALAQTTTNITFDVTITGTQDTAENIFIIAENGSVGALGNATLNISAVGTIQNNSVTTPIQVAAGLYFNQVDTINASFTSSVNFFTGPRTFTLSNGTISGGTGAYAGATGSLTLNFTPTDLITGSGSVTAGGKTTPLTLTNFHGSQGCPSCERDYSNGTLSGTVSPAGKVTGTFRLDNTLNNQDSSIPSQGIVQVVLNSTDSINLFTVSNSSTLPVVGGTGAYEGATGLFTATNVTQTSNSLSAQGTGTITTPAPGAPIITQVKTAFGSTPIANNTWLQINGTNLAPANTPSTGIDWSNAPDFASGKMPTKLGAIDSVTVDGKPAYLYFYCSAATNSNCATDQINVLSPLFDPQGLVPVVVTRNGVASAPFVVTKTGVSPALPLFDVKGHVVARHLDFSLMGPTTLYPGLSTPAKPGETIILVAYGFGASTNPGATLTEGSATQSGPLPFTPRCWISGLQANVAAALISPGLFQLNVTVPTQTPSGDNPIICVYPGFPMSPGALIAVQ